MKQALDILIKVYNSTELKRYDMSPLQMNNTAMDPVVRQKLNGTKPMLPFSQFYRSQLKQQKRALEHNPKGQELMKEGEEDYRINDCVYPVFDRTRLNRNYDTKRGKIYRVAEIDGRQSPKIFRLRELESSSMIPGTFYANELGR